MPGDPNASSSSSERRGGPAASGPLPLDRLTSTDRAVRTSWLIAELRRILEALESETHHRGLAPILDIRLANGQVHHAAEVNGRLFTDEACNADDAKGARIVLGNLEDIEPEAFCRRCYPRLENVR